MTHSLLDQTQEDTNLALHRSQKRLVRVREEKLALLDRVLLLESAAGLTNDEVKTAQVTASTSSSEFPLIDPPSTISLNPRPRALPVITTSTDLSHSNYNDPIGPALLPNSYPPRQRSSHLISTLAASKLKENSEARRIARGLPKVNFPVVSVLGLEGSRVAEAVERALAGELMVPVKSASERSSSKGKGREILPPPPAIASMRDMPNPFAASLPTPIPSSLTQNQEQQSQTLHQAIEVDSDVNYMKPKPEFDDSIGSPAGSAMSFEDGNRTEDSAPAKKKIKIKKPKVSSGITSGTFSIPFIPRNEDGTVKLPLPVGTMVLHRLGNFDTREHFHTERYIFPIGYECVRKYPSMIHKTETALYSCRIVDGGDESPRFEISPSDQDIIISAPTPTGAWSKIVKAANHLRERTHSNSVSGPDYYGLSLNVVKALIQEIVPNANDIPGYVWQTFIEDPDPSLPDAQKRKRGSGGPTKVVGMRRKFGKEGSGNGIGEETVAYNPRSFARSGQPPSQSSISPNPNHTSPSQYNQYPTPSSLSSLVHAPSNPYDLPGLSGIVDPSNLPQSPVIPNFYDPYAIPPPNNNYSSPVVSNGSPMFATDSRWGNSAGGGEEEAGYYAFDPSAQGGLPGSAFGRRASSSDGSI